jgi:hypothetical protein
MFTDHKIFAILGARDSNAEDQPTINILLNRLLI